MESWSFVLFVGKFRVVEGIVLLISFAVKKKISIINRMGITVSANSEL